MEPKLENVVVELTPESSLVTVFPLSVDNLESNVLVRRSGVESENSKVWVVLTGSEEVLRSRSFVYQIREEDVELVSLNNFRRRIIHVVVSLIVFVPLESGVYSVEITRLPWTILVGPHVHLVVEFCLHRKLSFVFSHAFSRFLDHLVVLSGG